MSINGASFDPLLVAEFMIYQIHPRTTVDPSDMRTFVYFSDVYPNSEYSGCCYGEESSEKEKKVQSKHRHLQGAKIKSRLR